MVIFTWDIATEWHNCTSPDQFNGRNAPFPPADNFEHLIIGTQFHCEVSFFCDEHGKLRGTGPAKRKDNVCFVRARVAPWASLAAKAVCGYRRAGKLCVIGCVCVRLNVIHIANKAIIRCDACAGLESWNWFSQVEEFTPMHYSAYKQSTSVHFTHYSG